MRSELEAVLIAAGTATATGVVGLGVVAIMSRRSPRAAAIAAPLIPVIAVAAALFVSVLVLGAAGRLMHENVEVLMDRVPDADEAALDAQFHMAIIEASHNVVMLHMMRSMFVNPKMNRMVSAVEMRNAFERILDLSVNA